MATTSAQRVRAHRTRRHRRDVQLTIEVSGQRDRRARDRQGGLCRRRLDGPEGQGPGGRDIHQRPVLRAAPRERCSVTVTP